MTQAPEHIEEVCWAGQRTPAAKVRVRRTPAAKVRARRTPAAKVGVRRTPSQQGRGEEDSLPTRSR